MSAVTSTGPRSFSSAYVSVYGSSTRPLISRSQLASSKSGIGPKCSTGHVLTSRWPGGMRLAISSGYRGPNSFTGPSSSASISVSGDRPPRRDRALDVLVGDVNVRDHPDLPGDHAGAHPVLLESVGHLQRREAQHAGVDEDHVGLHRTRIQAPRHD